MKKYCVVIEETISEEFELEAESEEDAIGKAIKAYKNGEFILESGRLEHKQLAVMEADSGSDIEDKDWIVF